MKYLLVRHRVRDFNEWKPVYDSHLGARERAGIKEKELLRDAEDSSLVFILFEVVDLERAKSFAGSAELREAMARAGVVGETEIRFLK